MFSRLLRKPDGLPAPATAASVRIDGREVPVNLKPHAQARRLILRMDKTNGGIRVTVPPRVSPETALDFVERNTEWVRRQLAREPMAIAFAHDTEMPFRGTRHRIVHSETKRGTVKQLSGPEHMPVLQVNGPTEHFERRIEDWLRRSARERLIECCQRHATTLDVKYRRVTVRDQTSRWGSCSSSGVLSFSWRLILAPDHVLDYVAAHEVAHLREMNHSKAFWDLVRTALPGMQRGRDWLKAHGQELHRYGRTK